MGMKLRILTCLSLMVVPVALPYRVAIGLDDPLKSEQKETIGSLIEQLGDPVYSRRELAKRELERIGYVTLDQLQAASFHPDPQIANTARFMVNSNQFAWTSDFDSPKVREILTNFSASESEAKTVCIDELARLEREEGIPALCRLARYESNGALAKRAAIHILKSPGTTDQTIETRKKRILALMADGESTACNWVLAYAKASDRFDLGFWKEQLKIESQLYDSKSSETNEFVVNNLGRWVVEQCVEDSELESEAVEIAKMLVDQMGLSSSSPFDDKSIKAIGLAQWALGINLPQVVQYQHSKLLYRVVRREPILSYYLAESYLQSGNHELAEKIAANAKAGIPSAADGAEWKESAAEQNDPLRSRLEGAIGYRNQSSKEKKRLIAEKLADRGLFAWAEAEYKMAADDDLTLISTLTCLLQLAEVQHSQDRFAEARDTLGRFQGRYEKERMFREQMRDHPIPTSKMLSQYYLYAGDAAMQSGSQSEALEHFYRSLEIDPENVDALIGLYKLNLDDEQSKRRQIKHAQITEIARLQIQELEEASRQANSLQYAEVVDHLVRALNSYAWIVANTEGNIEEAIVYSRQSVAFRPNDPALLDTLAHCYYADKRWNDAVEQQRKAVALKPNSPSMKRALKRFEDKLNETSKAIP